MSQIVDLSMMPAGATSLTITNNSWDPFVVNTNSGLMGAIRKITFSSIGNTNSAPVNSVAPTVSVNGGGFASVGSTVTATNGTWTDAEGNALTFSYQWYRADDNSGTNLALIAGATSASYTLTSGDAHKYVRVVVTANDGNGATPTATSTYVQVLNSAPVNSVAPVVTGTATVGNALSTTNGTWTDADGDSRTYSYQWYRADDNSGTNLALIAGANASSYTLTTSDAHKYLRVAVTANDGNGGITSSNSAYAQVLNSAPVNSAAPTVTGTATVGNALSTTNGTWSDADGDGRTYSYQWYRADDNSGTNLALIAGANSASHTLTTSDAHKYLRVAVTANDGNGGITSSNSAYAQVLNSAPVNSTAPTVTGTATVGNALSTTNGAWSDADGDSRTYTYQWYRADDSSGTNLAMIAGATSAIYTLISDDANKYLRVAVTANDGRGGTQTANSVYTQVTNSAPVNSVAPTVSGTTTVGNALATTNGTWSDPDGNSLTYTYQWYRADDSSGTNLVMIVGANASSYILTTSDAHKYLRVEVTASDGGGGTQTASSGYTQVANSPPVNSAVPTVTGTATVGNALSTTNGAWSDADGDGRTYSYQWYRADDNSGTNLTPIVSATSVSYTLTSGDANKYLRVAVSANDGNGGTQTATSAYTQITNSAPVNSAAPTVSGAATVGNALSTTNGTWTDADGNTLTYSYQWYRADDSGGTNVAAITGASSASYTLTSSDAHKYLRVAVTANDGNGGITSSNSAYAQVLNSAPVNSTAPTVTGTATVGNALSTTNGAWSDADGDSRTYTYQWYRADDSSGTNLAMIAGATSAIYTLTSDDANKYLRVAVTANDGNGGNASANSSYTQVASGLPGAPTGVAAIAAPGQAEISFTAPVSTGGSEITRYTATATPGGQSGYCDITTGSPAGSVCSVTVVGLTNGTSYTFTVKATNANGVGADSLPSNAVVPRLLQVDAAPGAVPGMAGIATATLSGGGATCTLQPGGSGGFGPASQVPPGFQAPHGQFAFSSVQCTGTVTLTLQYPQPLPAGIRFRKPDGAGGWFDPQDAATSLNVTVSTDRRTVTYDITNDGLGDTERTTPGAISDPFVPVLLAAPASGVQGIPTLSTWGLTLLSALAGLFGMRQVRRRIDETK